MKQEDFVNNRVDYEFDDKKVVVVENHNFVLPVWAEYCAKTKKEYRLITVDYHMDTRPLFSQYACKVCNWDMAKVNSYEVQRKIYNKYKKHLYDSKKIEEMARLYVYHDEHISVGYNIGYILDLYCICKEQQDYTNEYKNYFVIGKDSNLSNFCKVATEKDYILDIDLDFFNSLQDFEKYREVLVSLIRGTDIITIAREHQYFDYLKDSSEWSNDVALEKVLKLIQENV